MLSGLRAHVFLLLFVALAAYAVGFGVYFLKDDLSMAMFTGADNSLDLRSFTRQLLWPIDRTWDDIWRPVPALSWGADYWLFGADPWAFHLGNILGHALNTVLLYWLVQRLLHFRNAAAAVYGALFFALFPLFPEAVLWTTQRTVIFGVTFSLAALLAWHVWLLRGERKHLRIAIACSVCGLLSREHALAVTPLMGLMALLCAPAARKRAAFLSAAAIGLASVGAYFLLRHAIFGRFSGGYAGWESMSAYARDNDILADLPRTLRLLFLPVPEGAWTEALAMCASLALAAAWILALSVLLRRKPAAPNFAGFALLSLCWLLLSWAPVLYVFEIYPNLLNSRSAYHLMALPVAFLGAALCERGSTWRHGWLLPLLPLLLCAALLGRQISNYVAAGAQVRGLQCAILAVADPMGMTVVVDVPTECHGAPSVDAYLPALLAPPYAPTRVRSATLVQGLPSTWWAALNETRQSGLSTQWFRAMAEAPYLRPLFGVAENSEGAAVTLLAPQDLVLVRSQDAALPEIEVRVPSETASADLLLEVPGRSLTLLVPLQHLRPTAQGTQRIALQRILEQVPELARWPLPHSVFEGSNPLPVQWRIAVKSADGRTLGVSASRRMLLADF